MLYINIIVYFCRQQIKINMKTTENLKTIDQKNKKIKDLEIELEVYVNHSKFLENQTAKQSIEISQLEAEIRSLKDRIDGNNKHTLQLLDTQKTSKSFYI